MPLLNSLFKGYQITFTKRNILQLHMTDGFNTDGFRFDVNLFPTKEAKDRYEIMKKGNQMSLVSFVIDGGPKVASCVINNHLYNASPCGWKFLPREFGAIGGSDMETINRECIGSFAVVERTLLTSECIAIYRSHRRLLGSANNDH